MSQKVKCPVCNIEYDIRGFPTHYGTKHPVEFAKSIGSQPLKAATDGASLQDSAKLAALSDEVKAKDTQITQLQDSLTKSDAAFLEVTAELAKLNDRPISDGMILDFINNRLDEDTWAKIGTIKKFGLAPVEDSKKKFKKIHVYTESQRNSLIGKNVNTVEDALDYWPVINSNGIIIRWVEGDSIPEDAVMVDWIKGKAVETDGTYGFGAILEDSTQDRAEAARDAHNVEVVGSSPAPATNSELTVPVNDVQESPGEKWWREFQANLNK